MSRTAPRGASPSFDYLSTPTTTTTPRRTTTPTTNDQDHHIQHNIKWVIGKHHQTQTNEITQHEILLPVPTTTAYIYETSCYYYHLTSTEGI